MSETIGLRRWGPCFLRVPHLGWFQGKLKETNTILGVQTPILTPALLAIQLLMVISQGIKMAPGTEL